MALLEKIIFNIKKKTNLVQYWQLRYKKYFRLSHMVVPFFIRYWTSYWKLVQNHLSTWNSQRIVKYTSSTLVTIKEWPIWKSYNKTIAAYKYYSKLRSTSILSFYNIHKTPGLQVHIRSDSDRIFSFALIKIDSCISVEFSENHLNILHAYSWYFLQSFCCFKPLENIRVIDMSLFQLLLSSTDIQSYKS